MSATRLTPFHLAIQVRNLAEARDFYGSKMGLPEGRSSAQWIDFNLFGHQLVVHENPLLGPKGRVGHAANHVDGHGVPVPHFGVVLEMDVWNEFAETLRSFIPQFLIEPCIRFKGQPGEQATLFFTDPSGNALEFKAFRDIETDLFAS